MKKRILFLDLDGTLKVLSSLYRKLKYINNTKH